MNLDQESSQIIARLSLLVTLIPSDFSFSRKRESVSIGQPFPCLLIGISVTFEFRLWANPSSLESVIDFLVITIPPSRETLGQKPHLVGEIARFQRDLEPVAKLRGCAQCRP